MDSQRHIWREHIKIKAYFIWHPDLFKYQQQERERDIRDRKQETERRTDRGREGERDGAIEGRNNWDNKIITKNIKYSGITIDPVPTNEHSQNCLDYKL